MKVHVGAKRTTGRARSLQLLLTGGTSGREKAMLSQLRQRIEDVLRAFGGDEDAFNRFAEAERLGVYLRHGRIYATAIGQSHTARLAAAGVEVAAPDTGRKSLAMYAFSPPEGIP